MGLFDSSSSSTTQNYAATGSGVLTAGNGLSATGSGLAVRSGSVASGSGKVLSGSNSMLAESGSVQLGQRSTMLTGNAAQLNNVKAGGNVTVSTSDPAVLEAALAAMSSNSQKSIQAVTDLAASSAVSGAAAYNSALGELTSLATTQSTGGASLAATTIKQMLLWGLVIIGAVVVFLHWKNQ